MFPIGGSHPPMGMQQMSPQAQIGQELESMTQSGEISTEDKTSIQSALFEIGGELKNGRPQAGSAPPTQEEMSAKIDSLISNQVEEGNLTEEQAEALSEIFDSVQANRPEGGPPPGGGVGPGGPPPGAEGAGASNEASSNNMLSDFLELLQEQSASSYTATGTANGEGSFLFDYTA